MPRRKISDQRIAELVAEYQAWDPAAEGSITSDEMAHKYGVSRSTMYRILDERGVPIKSGRTAVDMRIQTHHHNGDDEGVVLQTPKDAVMVLLEAIIESRLRVKLLEEYIRQHGLEVPHGPAL